ncbi:MAG: tRNA (adenosine(37)-N6)-threonylcarbamoyltransferase complex dimerization subunit type 1 TsaB [Bacteroidales bacterium]|nr:tRNA (adenosine(37)-N6)-threonylcarbamoyltransferase complex dimerization subunit type 1 TsaB [Bacteroidales bacterium]
MARILLLDTSTALCSVALSEDGKVVASREDATRQHASLTAPFVKEVLDSQGLSVRDCDAVCVSMGPGSYTGLRVGVSTAKGLCFGAGIPLVAITSLETLVWQAPDRESYRYIVPMIDARRMEVFTCVYSPSVQRLSEVEAKVIDSESFAPLLAEGPVLFAGDGAAKCQGVITHPDAHFLQCSPRAESMAKAAEAAFAESRFENLAYFEPFYLKDFVATVPRRKLF